MKKGQKRFSVQGVLGPGDRLSDLLGDERVAIYRWVPSYADNQIRNGDHVLLEPEEGRHYGGKRGKMLTAFVKASELEYRQGDEYLFRGIRPRGHVVSSSDS